MAVTFFRELASLEMRQGLARNGLLGEDRMRCFQRIPFLFLALMLLALSGSTEGLRAEQENPRGGKPLKGYRVERIEQKRTETIAWLRIQVVADAGTQATWAVLQNVEAWDQFLRIFAEVTPIQRTKTMTRYRLSVTPPWPIPDFDTRLWMAKLPEQRLMLWRSSREILTSSHGRIEVNEIPGGTRVVYEMHSPAESSFPPWVVRIGLYLVLPNIAQDFYDRIMPQD